MNKRDKTLFNLPELRRGYIIQSGDRDFRPRDLWHRLSFFAGYKFIDSKNISTNLYLGPHLSLGRSILDNVSDEDAPMILFEGEELQMLPYNDFQILRSWDVGMGARLEAEYKLFQNVSIGFSSQMFFDFLQEGIDLIVGGGITYHFSSPKN